MKAFERFKAFRVEQKLTMRALADALGVTSSIVSDWEAGKAEIRKPNAMALELLYGVSWRWLMTGEGPMRVESKAPRNAQAIPLLDGLPSCGPSGEITDLGPHSEEMIFSAGLIQEVLRQCGAGSVETLFAARVQGDSMKPLLEPGDTILVNTALPLRLEPKKNTLHLVRKAVGSSEVRVKRIFYGGGVVTLRSENQEAFPDRYVKLGDSPIQDLVIGRVCWSGRNLVAPQAPSPGDW